MPYHGACYIPCYCSTGTILRVLKPVMHAARLRRAGVQRRCYLRRHGRRRYRCKSCDMHHRQPVRQCAGHNSGGPDCVTSKKPLLLYGGCCVLGAAGLVPEERRCCLGCCECHFETLSTIKVSALPSNVASTAYYAMPYLLSSTTDVATLGWNSICLLCVCYNQLCVYRF
jgi:hypothetical protein